MSKFFADLNPRFPAKGEDKYAVFCRDRDGRLVIIDQFKTRRGAENAAERSNPKAPLASAKD